MSVLDLPLLWGEAGQLEQLLALPVVHFGVGAEGDAGQTGDAHGVGQRLNLRMAGPEIEFGLDVVGSFHKNLRSAGKGLWLVAGYCSMITGGWIFHAAINPFFAAKERKDRKELRRP